MAAPVVQLRVPEDTLAAVDGARGDDTRSAWILALIERELLDDGAGREPAATSPTGPAASPLGAISNGESSPGTLCMGPGCWQRSTRRYGARRLPLCDGCKAALTGEPLPREIPAAAAA
jgi:hypothetical protein